MTSFNDENDIELVTSAFDFPITSKTEETDELSEL